MAVVALVVALAPTAGRAQQAPPSTAGLEVLSAEYDHGTGTLGLQLRADGTRDHALENLTVLVDSVPRTIEPIADRAEKVPAVLLAIDVSGSMLGEPIASAKGAAASLVGQLAEGDAVGLMTFANAANVWQAPTSDHSVLLGQLPQLVADGDTALYDGVLLGLETLNSASGDRKALVLLSDGAESGASAATEAEVFAAAETSDIEIFTFALGAGADPAFLQALADASGGHAYEVPDEASLAAFFTALGGRLGATLELTVRAPGLADTHTIEVRGRVDGQIVSTSFTLEVPPADLTIGLPSAGTAGEPIELSLEGVPADATLSASIDGAPVSAITLSRARALVDPWKVEAGPSVLSIEARQGSALVARGARALVIPELAPVLQVEPAAEGDRAFTASVRWQGATPPILVAMADGVEFARSSEGVLTATAPSEAAAFTFTATGLDGETLATETVTIPAVAESGISPLLLAVPLVGLVLAGGWFVRRRRSRPKPQPVLRPRAIRPLSADPPVAPNPDRKMSERNLPSARLVLTDMHGATRTAAVGPRPITLGSARTCDLVLEGDGIRAEHARLSLTPAGWLSIHGLAASSSRPYEGEVGEQWLTLQPGEEVQIGTWSVRLEVEHLSIQEEAS